MIRQTVVQKYQEMQAVLDEDLRTTLSHLEMEENAAVSALETLMEKNCSLIQEIEQDLARLTEALNQTVDETNIMVMKKKREIQRLIYDFQYLSFHFRMSLNCKTRFLKNNLILIYIQLLFQSFFSILEHQDLEFVSRYWIDS